MFCMYRALSEVAGARLPYDTLDEVRERLGELSPALLAYGAVPDNNYFAQARALAQVQCRVYGGWPSSAQIRAIERG